MFDTHSRSNFNCPTAQIYCSCFLLSLQLFFVGSAVGLFLAMVFEGSAVVFCCLVYCSLLSRQLFLTFRLLFFIWQLLFPVSAVVFSCLGSWFLLAWELSFQSSAVVLCCSILRVGQHSTAQLLNSTAVFFCWLGSCFFDFQQMFFTRQLLKK